MAACPRLTPHQGTIYRAFQEIGRSRYTDQGYRPLSDDDVERWCRRRGLTGEFINVLWWHVQRLDDVWLELEYERIQQRRRADAFFADAGKGAI